MTNYQKWNISGIRTDLYTEEGLLGKNKQGEKKNYKYKGKIALVEHIRDNSNFSFEGVHDLSLYSRGYKKSCHQSIHSSQNMKNK